MGPRLGGILPQKQEQGARSSECAADVQSAASVISAVHGWTDLEPVVGAPFAVPSIAAGAGKCPKGRGDGSPRLRSSTGDGRDAGGRAMQEQLPGCTVCAARHWREAQGSLVRRMRTKPPRPAPSLFGYFLGNCQKVTGSPQARRSSALERNKSKARSWIPAFAGMTSKEISQSKALDSGFRRNDEQREMDSA